MSEILVSIGLPTYNRPKGLQRTINSLVNQTYQNIEIIISDNCSENLDVVRVIEEAQKLDKRIKAHRQSSNRGPIYNFNFVLKQAYGKYFMWAADDDIWDEKFIEKLVYNLESSPDAVLSFCNICEIDPEERITDRFVYSDSLSDPSLFNRLKYFSGLKIGTFGKASLIYGLIKTEIIKDVFFNSFYDYYSSDNIIVSKIICKGPLLIENEILYKVGSFNEKFYNPNLGEVETCKKPEKYSKIVLGFMIKRRNYFSKSNSIITENVSGFNNVVELLLINYKEELQFIFKDISNLLVHVRYDINNIVHKFAKKIKNIKDKYE
jgi:glycosyltransferase involved in cell wall biosynthesis